MCQGKCNKQHSQYSNLFCSEKKGHDGLCLCSPKIEEKIVHQCKELIYSLREYNKDYDQDNENNAEIACLHEWADGITSSLREFSFCLNEREKIK